MSWRILGISAISELVLISLKLTRIFKTGRARRLTYTRILSTSNYYFYHRETNNEEILNISFREKAKCANSSAEQIYSSMNPMKKNSRTNSHQEIIENLKSMINQLDTRLRKKLEK